MHRLYPYLFAVGLLAGCNSHVDRPVVAPPALFDDHTATSGIDFTYRNGEEAGHYAILEALGGGVGLRDFDGDGLLDVFLPGGGYFDRTEAEWQKDKSKLPVCPSHDGVPGPPGL